MGASTTHPILSMWILIYSFDAYYVWAACDNTRKMGQIYIWNPSLPDLLCKHWFASSVWSFCPWVADVPLRETSQRRRARRNGWFCRLELNVYWKHVFAVGMRPHFLRWRKLGCRFKSNLWMKWYKVLLYVLLYMSSTKNCHLSRF